MKNLAIIPARSGSKGLPDKNIRMLCDKPLMAYSIEVALESKMFDIVHVSTDSERYAKIACDYGADVPFLRSAETSSDTATTWDAVIEVIRKYELIGKHFDTVMVLQPTTPLRIVSDIVEVYKTLQDKKAESVVSVCECEHCPIWSNTIGKNMCMDGFIQHESAKRRQDYDCYYRLNGAIYVISINSLLKHRSILYDNRCFAYIMPKERSIDIDTIYDFIVAEAIMKMTKDSLE